MLEYSGTSSFSDADAKGRDDPVFPDMGPKDVWLRLLATSDLHANLCPWDYFTDRPRATRGLSRTAGLIAQARAEQANCLLFDNGDFLQGSPLGDYYALERGLAPDEVHPVIAAMNLLDYDAVTLGNHEFSHGLEFLMQALKGATFPVVSANVMRRTADGQGGAAAERPLVAPHVLIDRRYLDASGKEVPLRIGVFGVCPPQVLQWEAERLAGRLALSDMIASGRAAAAELRAAGADLVIALSHSGIAADGDGGENVSLALAMQADVDAVIAGHTHQVFPHPGMMLPPGADAVAGTLAGKPAVMPGFFGSHLGLIDLQLRRSVTGKWHVTDHQAGVRAIAARTLSGQVIALTGCDPRLSDQAIGPHRDTRAWAQKPIGTTTMPLCSHFALICDTPASRMVAEAQAAHVRLALRGTEADTLPVLSAVAPFKAGGRGGPENYTDIPAGPLAMRHAAELYLHPNTLVALRVTGADLAEWLEQGASIYLPVEPGARDAGLIDPEFPSFNFDTIHGLTWTVDLSRPARFDARGRQQANTRRIGDLCHAGRPVAPGDQFILATNSYRAGGGGNFPATGAAGRVVLADRTPSRDILVRHITNGSRLEVPFAPNWRFRPMLDTTAILDTAPTARATDIAAFSPEDLGIATETGFRRFRLRL